MFNREISAFRCWEVMAETVSSRHRAAPSVVTQDELRTQNELSNIEEVLRMVDNRNDYQVIL